MKNSIVVALTAACAALVATSALAAAQSGTIALAPGQRRCIDLATPGLAAASATGFVNSGHKLKFVFLVKPAGTATFTELANSGADPVSSFANTVTKASTPFAFPGTFRVCANNMSNKPSTVTLRVAVDE